MEIVFYGPFGQNIPPERVGGAEVGCRRSVELLRTSGFSVQTVEKPTTYYGMGKFLFHFGSVFIRLRKIFRKNRDALFYMTGFYDRQLPFEYVLCRLAKHYGLFLVYEPKNGMLAAKYRTGGKLYRKLSDYIFKNSEVIFCQGLEYQHFLQELGYKNTVYHPNYVSSRTLEMCARKKEQDITVFIYVGRVTPSKNISMIIDIFRRFHCKNSQSVLYIIGGAQDSYRKILKRQIADAKLENAVELTGTLAFEIIANYLNRADFFLFPSKEVFEGHSNSLTEAMAFGVVPVASDIGFNRSVVGDDRLIVKTDDPEDYLKVVEDIIEHHSWQAYSDFVSARVHQYFSEDTVKTLYINTIRKFDGNRESLHGRANR